MAELSPHLIRPLSGSHNFQRVLAARLQKRSGAIKVAVASNRAGFPRVGFAIRGVNSAVLRNRVRRRLRAALRSTVAPPHDVVVMADARVASVAFATLQQDMKSAIGAAADLIGAGAYEAS